MKIQKLCPLSTFLIGIFVLLSLYAGSYAWAHPPQQITLDYDRREKLLIIEIDHVTHRPRKHLINRLIVYKNEEEIQKFSYVKQTNTTHLIQKVPLDLEIGDTVRVEAFCSRAGRKEKILVIQEREE